MLTSSSSCCCCCCCLGLPAELTKKELVALCGDSFNETQFNQLAGGGSTITKQQFLDALDEKTDVFLTHDWGDVGRDNHACVAQVNKVLQGLGLRTWFDSDRMIGNVKKQMAQGIDNAQCIVAFITARYIDKVGGLNAEDNW